MLLTSYHLIWLGANISLLFVRKKLMHPDHPSLGRGSISFVSSSSSEGSGLDCHYGKQENGRPRRGEVVMDSIRESTFINNTTDLSDPRSQKSPFRCPGQPKFLRKEPENNGVCELVCGVLFKNAIMYRNCTRSKVNKLPPP